jgi:hypothetical protein
MLKDTKGEIRSVNHRTDNTMTKRKGTRMENIISRINTTGATIGGGTAYDYGVSSHPQF